MVVAYLLFLQPGPDTSSLIEKHEHAVDSLKDLTRRAHARGDSIQATADERHRHDSVTIAAMQAKTTKTKAKANAIRPQVQPIIDRDTLLQQFVALQDSVISQQASTIDTLTKDLRFQKMVYTDLIHVRETEIQLQAQTIAQDEAIIEEQKKLLRRLRRQNTLKVIGGIGAGVLIGLSL